MKQIYKILFACILIVSTERLIRTQTHGFRVEKTLSDYPYAKEWEVETKGAGPPALDQPFYFLGSGVQCYAFLSEDQTTVLKLFKHYHAGIRSTLLRKIPLPKFLSPIREKILERRYKRMESIFSSARIAYEQLAEQTGVLYLNVNPGKGDLGQITLYDKIGIRYEIDLNKTPFLLQKKADLLISYLEENPKETLNVIDSLFSCIQNRNHLGIGNSDPRLYSNFGIFEGKVLEIDIGSFFLSPNMKTPLHAKREIFHETQEFKQWLQAHAPETNAYFEEKLLQAIRT